MLPSPKFIWNGAFINVTQHYSRVFVDLLLTLAPSSISGHPPLLYPVSHRLASGNGIVDFCPLSRLYILPPRLLTCSTSLHPSPHPYENSGRLRREAACGCLTARMPRMRCQAVPADSLWRTCDTPSCGLCGLGGPVRQVGSVSARPRRGHGLSGP